MEILFAIILISVLILLHEFGHFWTARRAGMLVEEFGIGLPPRLWGFKRGSTLYSVNALPIGGFVRIHGQDDSKEDINPELAFFSKPLHMRLAVLFAGVAVNFIFGVFLLAVILTAGAPAAASPRLADRLTDLRVEIISIAPDSPAEGVGLQMGDRLLKIGTTDETIQGEALNVSMAREFIKRNLGEDLSVQVKRGDEIKLLTAHARAEPPPGEGPLGISMADIGTLRYPWYQSIIAATEAGARMAGNIFVALYSLIRDLIMTGGVGADFAGPVGIVQFAGATAELGLVRFLNFAAILSINLAVLNILPIPALDGGRIVFLLIERIRGKPVSRKVEQAFHAAGMIFLLGLILLVTIHDIRRI